MAPDSEDAPRRAHTEETSQRSSETRKDTTEDSHVINTEAEDLGKTKEHKKEEGVEREQQKEQDENEESAPPLPDEELPPLPNEEVPAQTEDDGWDPIWDDNAQAYYFYNRFTGISQWENPRVPPGASDQSNNDGTVATGQPRSRVAGGYDPAIHGDYDPTAPYAQTVQDDEYASATVPSSTDPNILYTATGTFNRFTGKWQSAGLTPENFNDEHKSRRQLNAFFDVDAAANSHDGKSLKAERSGKKLTKKELKAFKDKRREKKEEKRRAWLKD